MCGIIAMLSKNNCKTYLLNGLKQLQNRGYDSAGICTMYNNFSMIKYASNNSINAINKLEENINLIKDANIGIGHTRWATHGAKTSINSHPHISYDNKISVVHNGIIENYLELKNELLKKNISFKSQTDTEVISNLLAYEYSQNNNFIECIKNVLKKMQGTWGLAILNIDEPNKLYCVRHGSPLLVSYNDNFALVSSEQSGFCGIVNNYIILESNDICLIEYTNNKIIINTTEKYKLKNTIENNFDLTPYPYTHWTLKEIYEQYDSSSRAISLGGRLLSNNTVKLGGLEKNKNILLNINNLILLGCGTSYHAGLVGLQYIKDLCSFNSVQIFDGSEFMDRDIPKLGKTALILLSQSGETKDLHRCIKIGKKNNLFLIGVINVVDSMIAREVNCGCYLNAGREVAVASTKAFTSQVIILSMIAIWFSQIHNINEYKRQTYIDCLRKLPIHIKETIKITEKYKKLCIDLLNKPNLFILGKGISEAIAKEGSLKIKEIAYIHSEAYSGSALKHGPFALLDKNFPVILISPNDDHYVKMDNVYHEIESRHSPILFITNKKDCNKKNSIILPYNEIYGSLLNVVTLQLIAYYLSTNNNINPDFPKNLAKVCTTE
jgi:glucosamine--fructose-6-phosphate aminotransferase (isomerizing)